MDQQRTALITGANKGIGFEVARQLAERGFRIILTARDHERGTEAGKRLQESGAQIEFIPLDVAHRTSMISAVDRIRTVTDSLHVLVNNAGILEDAKLTAIEADPDTIMRTFSTNTLGPLLLIQMLWPLLANSGDGRIINVSSGMGALTGMDGGYAAYRISKAALNAVTRIFAGELSAKHIAVNSVCPGWVRTDMGGTEATRTTAQGADTIVWLATEAPLELSGQFLRDRQPIAW